MPARSFSARTTRRSMCIPGTCTRSSTPAMSPANPFDLLAAIGDIEAAATALLEKADHLVTIGGDHTIALPLLRAVAAKHGPVSLIHFDAHLDTWDTYFGAPYTHGTPFRRAVEEGLLELDTSAHVGIRGPLFAKQDLIDDKALGFAIVSTAEVARDGVDQAIDRVRVARRRPSRLRLDRHRRPRSGPRPGDRHPRAGWAHQSRAADDPARLHRVAARRRRRGGGRSAVRSRRTHHHRRRQCRLRPAGSVGPTADTRAHRRGLGHATDRRAPRNPTPVGNAARSGDGHREIRHRWETRHGPATDTAKSDTGGKTRHGPATDAADSHTGGKTRLGGAGTAKSDTGGKRGTGGRRAPRNPTPVGKRGAGGRRTPQIPTLVGKRGSGGGGGGGPREAPVSHPP